MNFLELDITLEPKNPWVDILIAQLAEIGFDSFQETKNGLQAYGDAAIVSEEMAIAQTLLGDQNQAFQCTFQSKVIPQQNWNEQWESQFEPVHVEDYVSIIAPFHEKENVKPMVVEIMPKMSFGTGHHQTTYMMTKALFELDEVPAVALDMGTGTGVLAIVLEKLGAKEIVAVDIEDWSVENTIENAQRNECTQIQAICGDIDAVPLKSYDLIVANINKNILFKQMEHYSQLLKKGGILLLSGFFQSDIPELIAKAENFGLVLAKKMEKETWGGLQLLKK